MESPNVEPAVIEQSGAPSLQPPDLNERVAQLERDLQQTQQSLRLAETRGRIHRALAGAGAVDADAVALVLEAALPKEGEAFDDSAITKALEELRRMRPALFRAPAARGAAMPARVERPPTRLEDAAATAAKRGDRASLMHYLRLKRAV